MIKVSAVFLIASSLASITNAALIGRDLDGDLSTPEAYFDSTTNLTWLSDANFAMTTANNDGSMDWFEAMSWADGLEINGIDGWRLPTTSYPDPTCSSESIADGFNCTDSELGNMFYNILGGNSANPINEINNSNYELFENIQIPGAYWSSTEVPADLQTDPTTLVWCFNFWNGDQGRCTYNSGQNNLSRFAWAVHDGDVGATLVPEPPVIIIFCLALLSIFGLMSKSNNSSTNN